MMKLKCCNSILHYRDAYINAKMRDKSARAPSAFASSKQRDVYESLAREIHSSQRVWRQHFPLRLRMLRRDSKVCMTVSRTARCLHR